jgi:di/tricarboxylate transporter
MEFNYNAIHLLLGIIFCSLILFSTDWVSPDVVALGLVLTLALTGLLDPKQAFAGFGSDTVIMIIGLLILTAALLRTGVVDFVGRLILKRTGTNPTRLLIVIMAASAFLGAFMSNTASTAFFVPIVFGIAQRAKLSPSKLLMPLAFASILTSSVSLISTSTNLVVSGLMTRYDLKPIGMFEMAPVGIPIAAVGILYMLTIGRKLIPDRSNPDDLQEEFGVRNYLTEILLLPDSPLVGKTLAGSQLGESLDLQVLRIVRDKSSYLNASPETVLVANDVLLVKGNREDILKIKDASGIDIKSDVKLSDRDLETEAIALVEATILPNSRLSGRTLKNFRFRDRYDVHVLGINRHGQNLTRKMSRIPLRLGDVLLIQGDKRSIAKLEQDRSLGILREVTEKRPNIQRAPIAILIFVAALAIATFKVFGISLVLAVMLGVLFVFLTKCITPNEAYQEIEWKAVFLIACMLALGTAMDQTGTAKYLSQLIVGWTEGWGTTGLLSGFFLLTVFLTQPMSNQAAAIVVLPIAIETANHLGLNPRTFAMMVAVAASCSYLTPLEPSCLMVYGPGRYKFSDFLKVGGLLTVLIYFLAIFLVPRVWPLQGNP